MDQNQPEGERGILSFEHAYMGAMHNRVNGYKTLTLWMYHPGMQHILKLAIMECKRDYKQDWNYKFSPYDITSDKNAANQLAIEKVYGKEFLKRVVTFQ